VLFRSLLALDGPGFATALESAQIVVNTVPGRPFAAGMAKALKRAKALKLAFDMTYADPGNPSLKAAASKALAVDGSQMLLEQGALSFRCWCGRPAPKAAMRQALGH